MTLGSHCRSPRSAGIRTPLAALLTLVCKPETVPESGDMMPDKLQLSCSLFKSDSRDSDPAPVPLFCVG